MICFVCKDTNFDTKGLFRPTREHIKPRSKGGSDNRDNIAISHAICNSMRGNKEDFFLEKRPIKFPQKEKEEKINISKIHPEPFLRLSVKNYGMVH